MMLFTPVVQTTVVGRSFSELSKQSMFLLITFACCKLCFCHDEDVASIDVFESFSYQLLNKECLNSVFKLSPFSCFELISEHFGENCMTHSCKVMVPQTLCILSGTSCMSNY